MLAERGLEHAKKIAHLLEGKELGKVVNEGSQFYFEINEAALKDKADEMGLEAKVI